jgi:hypothetical protein
VTLVVLAVKNWDPVGPQSLICNHRDDPKGTINFRVDVGRGDDRVRFADRQTLPVQTSRDWITFLEKESNSFHLADGDGDDAVQAMDRSEGEERGIPAPTAPAGLNFDHRHDTEHRTSIDRHRLTFQEQALTKGGQPGAVMMNGRCQPVAAR